MNNHLSYHLVVFQSSLEENYLITKDSKKKKKKKGHILNKKKKGR